MQRGCAMFGPFCITALRMTLRRPHVWLGMLVWAAAWAALRVASPISLISASRYSEGLVYDVVFMSGWLGAGAALSAATRLASVLQRASVAERASGVALLSVAFAFVYTLVALSVSGVTFSRALLALGAGASVLAYAFPALVAALLCVIPRGSNARSLLYWSCALLWNLASYRSASLDERASATSFLPILGLALALATLSLPMRDRVRRASQAR